MTGLDITLVPAIRELLQGSANYQAAGFPASSYHSGRRALLLLARALGADRVTVQQITDALDREDDYEIGKATGRVVEVRS